MAIPSAALYLDFNPATYDAPDGTISSITAGGMVFNTSPAGPASLVSDDGPRHLLSTVNFLNYPSEGPTNADPLTFAYLVEDPIRSGGNVSYFSRHAATLGVRFQDGVLKAQEGNEFGTFAAPEEGPMVIVGTKVGPQSRVYLNNELKASTDSGNGYVPAAAPAFISAGKVYRVLFWNRVLSPAELSEVYADLMSLFSVEHTIAWDAPPSTSPITGYVVRALELGEVVETPLPVDQRTFTITAAAGTQVQVFAKSELGLSVPAQVTL